MKYFVSSHGKDSIKAILVYGRVRAWLKSVRKFVMFKKPKNTKTK